MAIKLNRLVAVDLREVWEHEAREFTPWLAEEENLAILAETLGLAYITDVRVEQDVGRFSADIVAKDDQDNHVLIENQLEPTDHRHLGQVMTYLASLDGNATIVWIAKQFLPEHRAAIDWLNNNTTDNFNFFAVELGVVKIGDDSTVYAPIFNIVSKPNEFIKETKAKLKNAEEMSIGDRLRVDYWESFSNFLEIKQTKYKIKSLPYYYYSFSAGKSGYYYWISFSHMKNKISVDLYMPKDENKTSFDKLFKFKNDIEKELGFKLNWYRQDDKKSSCINISYDGLNFEDKNNWPEYHEWMLEKLEQFDKVFKNRILQL